MENRNIKLAEIDLFHVKLKLHILSVKKPAGVRGMFPIKPCKCIKHIHSLFHTQIDLIHLRFLLGNTLKYTFIHLKKMESH